MNQPKDDYAALHSYIQLVELEIDQVINGGMSCEKSGQTEPEPSLNKTHCRPPTLSFPKNTERIFQGKASKPPKGSKKEKRINNTKSSYVDTGIIGLPTRKDDRRTVLDLFNGERQRFVRTEGLASSQWKKHMNSSPVDASEVEDLYVVEDTDCKDELLQSILDTQENNELLDSDVSSQEEGDLLCDERINEAPNAGKIKKRPTDLQKLMDTDRDSLILGPGVVVREKDCDHCPDWMSGCSLTIHHCHHHEHHHKHHHHDHHRCASEPGVCPVLQLDPMVGRLQSCQPCQCHHKWYRRRHHQQGCCYCSVSDNDLFVGLPLRKSSDPLVRFRIRKNSDLSDGLHTRKIYGSLNSDCCLTESCDPLDKHRKRKCSNPVDEFHIAKNVNALNESHRKKCTDPLDDHNAKTCSRPLEKMASVGSSDPFDNHGTEKSFKLLKINQDAQRSNKTSLARHSPHTARIDPVDPLSIPNPSPPSSTDLVDSEATTPLSDLEIPEDDKDQDVSTSDRSYTDSELRDIFDSADPKLTSNVSGCKLSRNSYPNDSLIISPPPGFASPDSEDEMWVKVRLVTRSHDDLRCRNDKHSAAELDNLSDVSEFQYYPTSVYFDGAPQLSQRRPMSPDDLFIPSDCSLEKGQSCTNDKGNKSSNKRATTLEQSSSSPAQSGTRIIPSETLGSEKLPRKEYSSTNGHCAVGQESEELFFENSKSLVAPDAEVILSDLSVDESTFSIPTDILRPTSLTYSKSVFINHSDSSVIPAQQSSEGNNQSKGHGYSTGKHQILQNSFHITDQKESIPYPTDTGVVVTPDSLDSSLSSELPPTLEEDQNNNTSRNILSMCLASDCKLLKSCRLHRSTQSHVKLHSDSQTSEQLHECAVNMMTSERSSCSQNPSSSITQISDDPVVSSQRKDEATDAHLQLQTTRTSGTNSSEAGSTEATESTVRTCTKGTWAKETMCLEEKHTKDQCSVGILNSVDTSGNCVLQKATLKDTAVQTSLEVGGFVAGITEKPTGHIGVRGQTVKDIGQDIDRDRCGNGIGFDGLQGSVRSDESNKTCDKGVKEGTLHCRTEPTEIKIVVPDNVSAIGLYNTASEIVAMTAEEKTPFRTSLLRSKSVNESQKDGSEMRNRRVFRPGDSCLSGSLRELSHLNIDVSQRLIGGEQRFVVTNGSPELQIVVNALTPVLTRRSRAKNTRRVHNLDSVTEFPGSLKASTDNEPTSAAIELNDDCVDTDLSLRSSSFEKNPNCLDSNQMFKELPVYARFRDYDGSNKNNIENNISIMQEDLTGKNMTSLKERGHNRISRSASARAPNAAGNINSTEKHAEDNVNEELFQEFDQAEKGLFLSPKLSHTWHGSSTRSFHRSAPKMGLGRKLDGGVKYASRADGSIRPIVFASSPQPSASQAQEHANTMPVISRTLLDALHKRYCAYQYSNHYQTIQQFSLLKLDSTITTGNQAVTALLAEPLHARGHEVQAAPPSPEIMARLRMLKKAKDLNTDKPGIQQMLHSPAKEQPSISFCQPQVFQQSLLEQDPMELTTSAEEGQPQNSWFLRHDSSLELQDKLNHGGKHHTELEAAEALKWLRAAGFPQYAQMFDDGQFPVDMGIVERDHDFLDKDSLQSLFRRLETLNRYAGIKRDSHLCKKSTSEEEDEDDFCALSERWEYQKSARRWSRKDLAHSSQLTTVTLKDPDLAARSGSHDSLLADQDSGSQVGDSPLLESKISHKSVIQSPGTSDMVSISHQGLASAEIPPGSTDQTGSPISPPLRRATSEKTKTTKNLFKKMEGMKSGKSRRQSSHRNIVEISSPVVADREHMQAKLEKLNCVDILQDANTQLSPLQIRGKVSECSDHGLASSTESHHLPSSTFAAQASPQPPHQPSSPRPHSDFLLRSKEGRPHVPSHSGSHVQPCSTSPNQRPALAHDSSFEEYYQAQTAFLQNLQASPRSTAENVRKNNSETNLMEIFLVPQDHQPGRFPRVLQNGYIETEACGTAVNIRTGSIRLGRNSCMKSDHGTASLRSTQLSEAESLSNRLSVYDNCSPSEGKRSEESQNSSAIPSATEVRISGQSSQTTASMLRESTEVGKHGFVQEVNSDSSREDSRDTSRESSVVRTTWNFSNQPLRNSDHERSVSFESTSSQSPDDSTLVNVEDLDSTDSKSSKLSSSDSFSSKSKVTHSSSVDSYFRGNSSNNERPLSDSSTAMPATTFQENYDEFDRILQELYKNINDLTTFMDKDKSEKTPRLVRASTSPLPAGSPHPHSPLHVTTAPVRPILRPQQTAPEPKSPSSATSDLVHSPASPRSPQDFNEPLDFYGALELDHENSSSGGEGSNTAESGSEDQALTDISQDDSLDQIIEVSRERRDSGVGHSLTRAPSDRRRKKIRWHSFQKSHRPDISSRAMQINSLTVSQLVRLQKLSLLRLTGIMEKCLPVNKSGWNWMVPRFMKRHKAPDFSDKNVFGVPLSVMAQRTGQPLPQCVLYAMRYLRRTCPSAVGIFRKSGVKSKIQQLRDYLEAHPDTTNFDGENAYNVADMLKTFFRDLPECLLTNKMSETFRSIYTYVPQSQRLDAIQAAILLLPDENREVLQSILLFLSDISVHEADHQMNASNLAVCFTPTVFHLGPRQSVPYSPKRNRKNSSGIPDPREIMEQKAAHECLLMMITDCKKLFTVPSNLFRQLQVQSVAHVESSLPQDIGSCPADVRAFGQEKIQMVLKESHDKNRGWIPTMTIGDVEVFHRKPMDDCLLKEWKLIVDIEAPPVEVLRRIMHERHTWDEDLLSWSVVERLDQHSDIFQFVLNSMAPHPPRNFCVLRYWRSDLNKGACALITMSVEHSDSLEIQGVWAVDLGTYYLMEPCGSGRSRLTYITRVDTRGRMPEWYTKIFGHICANFLDRLKESFKQDASGPETKV